MNLKTLILAELEIDNVTKDIEIRYIVEGSSCPLKIKNDMGVKLYFEVKKNAFGIGMYPLSIDTTDKIVGDIRNFDCSSGEIVCVEGTERDTEALVVTTQTGLRLAPTLTLLCERTNQSNLNVSI